jgi:hypothetical protein
MILSDEQRKKIFEEGKQAAALEQDRRICPYLSDETPERIYIRMAGFGARQNYIPCEGNSFSKTERGPNYALNPCECGTRLMIRLTVA